MYLEQIQLNTDIIMLFVQMSSVKHYIITVVTHIVMKLYVVHDWHKSAKVFTDVDGAPK